MTDEKKNKDAVFTHDRINGLFALLGIALVAAGAFWIYEPAGPIVAGLMIFFDASRKQ